MVTTGEFHDPREMEQETRQSLITDIVCNGGL